MSKERRNNSQWSAVLLIPVLSAALWLLLNPPVSRVAHINGQSIPINDPREPSRVYLFDLPLATGMGYVWEPTAFKRQREIIEAREQNKQPADSDNWDSVFQRNSAIRSWDERHRPNYLWSLPYSEVIEDDFPSITSKLSAIRNGSIVPCIETTVIDMSRLVAEMVIVTVIAGLLFSVIRLIRKMQTASSKPTTPNVVPG